MDLEKSLNSKLLEEVFTEVEGLEDAAAKETGKDTKSGSLEDLEKEPLATNRTFSKINNYLEEFNFLDTVEEKESVVHEGLTDSSDDEDNKYFEERSYNECGRTLKSLIKQKNDLTAKSPGLPKAKDHWGKSTRARKKPETESEGPGESASNGRDRSIKGDPLDRSIQGDPIDRSIKGDPILGMNIINPLYSFIALREKLTGRASISTSRVKHFLETPASKESDWVTGGAIVSKSTRTSQKGNQYCAWQLSDLRDEIKTVRVLLFGSAYKEYWKTSLGTVVGVLNPIVMENKEKSEATFRVDNAQCVLVIGTSKDYGVCKSKKKNGENCSAIVNKSKCEYCVYHIKKEYNKACRRADLQPPKIGRNLEPRAPGLRAKVLGKSEIFYGGKTFTGTVGKQSSKQLKKDEERLKLLSQARTSDSGPQKQNHEVPLKRSWREEIPGKEDAKRQGPALPQPESQMIDLGLTFSKKERRAAMVNALKYVREHGPLKKLVDGDRARKKPEQICSIKRKVEDQAESQGKKAKPGSDAGASPSEEKRLRNGITEEFLELMNSGARNEDLMRAAEGEERDKYFSKLEAREKIENKMASTFKVECKAVRCLRCRYKAFSASELCRREGHPLKVVSAVKRFWKCGGCGCRTVSLEVVPLQACRACGGSRWERASMMAERRDGNVARAALSLRGDEEKFLGAGGQQANLNLLVPE